MSINDALVLESRPLQVPARREESRNVICQVFLLVLQETARPASHPLTSRDTNSSDFHRGTSNESNGQSVAPVKVKVLCPVQSLQDNTPSGEKWIGPRMAAAMRDSKQPKKAEAQTALTGTYCEMVCIFPLSHLPRGLLGRSSGL